MATKKNPTKDYNYNRPNIWGMMRDIIIASMNKGLFIPAAIFLLLLILFLKLNSEDTRILLKEIFDIFTQWKTLGWVIALFSIIGWIYNTKYLRRIHAIEMRRIAEEKKLLQEKNINEKLPSSD